MSIFKNLFEIYRKNFLKAEPFLNTTNEYFEIGCLGCVHSHKI